MPSINMKETKMAADGVGVVGALVATVKSGWLGKLALMFAPAAITSTIVAAYRPKSGQHWYWHALGAGIAFYAFGRPITSIFEHYVNWLEHDDALLLCGGMFGGLGWGLVGLLSNLQEKMGSRATADLLGKKIGLPDEPETKP